MLDLDKLYHLNSGIKLYNVISENYFTNIWKE